MLPAGEGIRVEAGIAEGVPVPVHYDPLLMKVIARGTDRAEAIARLDRALAGCVVEGVRTTVPFLRRVLADDAFRAGRVHTQMIEEGAFRHA